jgi:hypothetical protein
MNELRRNYLRPGAFNTSLLALPCMMMMTASFGSVARDDGARSDRIGNNVLYYA